MKKCQLCSSKLSLIADYVSLDRKSDAKVWLCRCGAVCRENIGPKDKCEVWLNKRNQVVKRVGYIMSR